MNQTENSGGSEDLQHYNDYMFAWKSIMAQKTPIVCYKEGSNEIIGANFTYVTHKDDHFVDHFKNGVSFFLEVCRLAIFFVYKFFICNSIHRAKVKSQRICLMWFWLHMKILIHVNIMVLNNT